MELIGLFDGKEFENRQVTFVVGEACEANVVAGIEQAVKKMKKSEKARVTVKAPHAYGAQGNQQLNIPPNADLVYEVTLSSFEKVPFFHISLLYTIFFLLTP